MCNQKIKSVSIRQIITSLWFIQQKTLKMPQVCPFFLSVALCRLNNIVVVIVLSLLVSSVLTCVSPLVFHLFLSSFCHTLTKNTRQSHTNQKGGNDYDDVLFFSMCTRKMREFVPFFCHARKCKLVISIELLSFIWFYLRSFCDSKQFRFFFQ